MPSDHTLRLTLRTRDEQSTVRSELREVPASQTAIVICDMWDKHWCQSATRRCDQIARKMAPVIESARAKGVTIIHAPSDCMEFYKDAKQRQMMQSLAKATLPDERKVEEPALPIDDSDGGCDDEPQCKSGKAWTSQHPAIRIAEGDGISDNGREIYSLFQQKGINNLLIMGVHTNMCVLGRSFAIRQMTKWGIQCVLVRDLTDTMYNPRKRPFVPHEQGTELVIQHIEKYWCPTTTSAELVR